MTAFEYRLVWGLLATASLAVVWALVSIMRAVG